MDGRYSRNIPALTPQEMALLRGKKAAVIGCGGLGGYLIEYLCRLGIGSVVAVDGDVFDESNLNRQLLSQPSLLGQSKAETAASRARAVNPGVEVVPVRAFLDESNARVILSGCDVVLDGMDNIPTRLLVERVCGELGIPYVFGAIEGWVAQAGVSMPGDGLARRLYPEGTTPSGKSVLSFTPALCAAVQTALCVKLLTGGEVESGKLYYFDLLHQEFETIPLMG